MKKMKRMTLLLIWLLCLSNPHAQACTAFHMVVEAGHYVGKNYDWSIGNGLVIVNKRHLQKQALGPFDESPGRPVHWIAEYGSITFNQYGRELPMGGINEAGLVIEVLLLGETAYPSPDSRPYLSMAQWVQYQLDTAATTGQVLSTIDMIRIYSNGLLPGLHYFICDRSGTCAVVEFLDGRSVIYTGDDLQVHALANRTYKNSMDSWQCFSASNSNQTWQNRFNTTAFLIEDRDVSLPEKAVECALKILKRVAQGSFTKWQIVYDLSNLRVYFATPPLRALRQIKLASIDFSCDTPVKVLDLHAMFTGDSEEHFKDYSRKVNFSMIDESFRNTGFLSHVPAERRNRLADYPDEFLCRKKID